jgi:hypothetical protein
MIENLVAARKTTHRHFRRAFMKRTTSLLFTSLSIHLEMSGHVNSPKHLSLMQEQFATHAALER